MCGIAGLLDTRGPVAPELIGRMTATLRHRGPDDEGYCLIDTRTGTARPCGGEDTPPGLELPALAALPAGSFDLALGHRRLSILDLSPAGHQPMSSPDGTCWLAYNGEIYNYVELRRELEQRGHSFASHSDTEVLLHAYQEWGVACLERFIGMWGFALWDGRRGQLFCARDRFGIKPFFYAWDGSRFRFASEIKALLADPAQPRAVHEQTVFDYLAHGKVDHRAETFFQGIRTLPPAHYLLLDVARLRAEAAPALAPRRYWDLGRTRPVREQPGNAPGRFRELLEDSVRLQLRSDVPVGTCLSGGLDSSTVVCLVHALLRRGGVATEQIGEHLKTFSSCFDDARFDERRFIKHVLDATTAEANFVFPQGEQLVAELDRLVWHLDEPFAGTSVYAQWNVFRRVAERGVKVILDGQGSDELLAGYAHFYSPYHLDLLAEGRWWTFWREWHGYRQMHQVGARSSARALLGVGLALWMPRLRRWGRQLLGRASLPEFPGLNRDFVAAHPAASNGGVPPEGLFRRQLYRDVVEGLPSLLRHEDRNSMAFSVESRVPFLDHRLVEYVFALPAEQKIHGGWTKHVLRQAMRGVLPEAVRRRTDKMGFVTPEMRWVQENLVAPGRELLAAMGPWIGQYCERTEMDRLLQRAAERVASPPECNFLWRVINLAAWWKVFRS